MLKRKVLSVITVCLFSNFASGELPSASAVKSASGLNGGLCVVIGTVDGEFEASLAADGRTQVQGLALTDESAVTARKNLFTKKLYPAVSITYEASVKTLPYMDMLVNVLVADLDGLGADAPSDEEIDRVLAYGGTAYLKKNAQWSAQKKAIPSDINRYTHWKDDSTLSSFQEDYRAGMPNQIRWIGSPSLGVSSGTGSNRVFESERVSGGAWMAAFAGRLTSRDAFSGVMLWQDEEMFINRKAGSQQAGGEQFAANEKRLFYFESKIGGNLIGVNIRTGELEKRYAHDGQPTIRSDIDQRGNPILNEWDANLMGTCQTLLHNDNIILVFGNTVYCFDEESQALEWKWSASSDSADIIRTALIQDTILAAAVTFMDPAPDDARKKDYIWNKSSARGYFADLKTIVGIRLGDGELQWTQSDFGMERVDGFHELVAGTNGKFLAIKSNNDAKYYCIDAHTGTIDWVRGRDHNSQYNGYRGNAVSLRDENMFGFVNHSGFSTVKLEDGMTVGKGAVNGWGSCPTGTITPNYWISRYYFGPVSDLQTELPDDHNARSVTIGGSGCNMYPIVGYGAYYYMGGRCSCRRGIPTQSCAIEVAPKPVVVDDNRLSTAMDGGLITDALPSQDDARESLIGSDWGPTSLGHYLPRTELTCEKPEVKDYLWSGEIYDKWRQAPAWTAMSRRQTRSVTAGDLTLVAHVHEHRLTATRNGEVVWNYVAGSRISGDPAFDGTRAYFGSHDGYVYAVNLSDGSLAWKFMAAPMERRMNAWNQIESCWPVFGIALADGKLYATAGRLAKLEQGVHAYCLDASDGDIVWHVKNVSGYATQDAITQARHESKSDCDPQRFNMADIQNATSSFVLNDVPILEDGLLKVHEWSVDVDNPTDVLIWKEGIVASREIPRTKDGKRPFRAKLGNLMEVRNGLVYVSDLGTDPFRIGLTDAAGRTIISLTKERTKRVDLGLRDLPDGVYFVWIQIGKEKQAAKVRLISR